EDLRDTSRIYEIGQVELLAEFLRRQAGQLLNVATLSTRVRASQDSIRRWIAVLEGLYYCFRISPWSNNIGRSLLKEPKVYLWDWSTLDTPGARHENLVAVHLLKAIHWWQDTDMGDFGLYFLRTKDQREVDFLITQDTRPYALIEVKTSEQQTLSGSLAYFQRMTGAPHAFQVVMEADYAEMDCFDLTHPVKVPARTLLSQLV
ncbi:MAG: DUF4143 domain-containing protein, partial [candidate division Zixibacteria bacterium]|nr:DUF4143 domain-containing protein [candidate division Zixibacteria bacterium]